MIVPDGRRPTGTRSSPASGSIGRERERLATTGQGRRSACIARIDDYLLGGGRNFPVDREVAQKLLAQVPEYREFVVDSHAYTWRCLGAMIDSGVRQFIYLGAGVDGVGVRDVLEGCAVPEARLAYVETDPVCVALLESRTRGVERAGVHPIDPLAVSWVLDRESVWRQLDRDRPVGILLPSLLHYELSDDATGDLLRRYHDGVAPGSMLALTHVCGDRAPATATRLQTVQKASGTPIRARSRAHLAALVRPWGLVSSVNPTDDVLRLGTGLLACKPKSVRSLDRSSTG